MDPNANLAEQRKIAAEILALSETITSRGDEDEINTVSRLGERLAELVQALDEWMSHRGFTPAAWMPGRVELTTEQRARTMRYCNEMSYCPICDHPGTAVHAKDCPLVTG